MTPRIWYLSFLCIVGALVVVVNYTYLPPEAALNAFTRDEKRAAFLLNEDCARRLLRLSDNDYSSNISEIETTSTRKSQRHVAPEYRVIPSKAPSATPHRVLQHPKNACRGSQIPLAVIGVEMELGKRTRRQFLRTMIRVQSRGEAHPIFVLAIPEEDLSTEAPWDEIEAYNDILIFDNPESYDSLVNKTQVLISWYNQHCASHVPFLVKLDDDVALNWGTLRTILREAMHSNFTYMGHVLHHSPVERDAFAKNREVSPVFLRMRTYPKYVSGPIYILSSSATKVFGRIFADMFWSTTFRNEDAFVGLVLRSAGILARGHNAFVPTLTAYRLLWCGRIPTEKSHVLPCPCKYWASIHCDQRQDVCFDAWRRAVECTVGQSEAEELFGTQFRIEHLE